MTSFKADKETLDSFIETMFNHATAGSVSLRVFPHEEKPPLKCDVSAPVGDLDQLKSKAFEIAQWAATYREPGVFAPPIASFKRPDVGIVRTRTVDIVEGYVCSIECDEYAAKALQTLRFTVGQPTMVVASGGEWTNPKTEEVEPKLHIHYRLSEPTKKEAEHKKLRHLRSMLCDLVDADATSKSVVHPIRWPGSVHRKGAPKIATIVELNEHAEIDLDSTIEEVEGLTEYHRRSAHRDLQAGLNPQTDDMTLITRCASLMRNNDLEWSEWNRLVMAFWRATGGSDAGFEAARIWSSKSTKHDDVLLGARWQHYRSSPPTKLGVGTLIYAARQVDRNFVRKRETKFSQGESKKAKQAESVDHQKERDGLPQIKLVAGYLDKQIDMTEAYLAETGQVYQRNRELVRVARLSKTSASDDPIRRRKGAMAITPCDIAWLKSALCRTAAYFAWSKSEEDWVQINPPGEVCSGLLANSGHWEKLEVLTAISEIPVIDNNGRIIDTPGHDRESGIYFDPGCTEFRKVEDAPTKSDALAALKYLNMILEGFPFVDEASRSVAIGVILLPFRRAFLRSAPMSAITAPKMGSGKSLIATIVGYIATGREPVMISQAKDAEEEKKRLLGILKQGDPVINLDNIERPIDSDALCTILTSETWSERVLGVNQTIRVSTAVSWIATGNNLSFAGDMSTRALVCSIDAKAERPDEREFDVNLHDFVPANRGTLVAACLTILKAYDLAAAKGERVKGLRTFGRFEEWSRFIREPLVWLGLADPCDTRKKIEQRDPIRDQLGGLLESWVDLLGDENGYTVNQAIKAIQDAPVDGVRGEQANALRESFIDISKSDKPNPREIGKFISKHENRIEGTHRFGRGQTLRRAQKWIAEPCELVS